jgi:hypothetical protein
MPRRSIAFVTSWVAALVLSSVAIGCRATRPTAVVENDEWSRIVVHASVEPPVELRISPGIALVGGNLNPGGELPVAPFERVDAFPVERRCRMQSACSLVMRDRLGTVVFAFDPVVEVEIGPPSGLMRRAEVRYRDPASVSAALAEINERGGALELSCLDTTIERAQRLERAAPIERELLRLAAAADRPLVERAAWLALVQGQCTGAAENRAAAKRLLDALEPTAPELGPWTDAVRRIGALTGERARADALVDAVIERHPDPAVGARLLFLRLADLGDDGDPRIREATTRELASPRFARTAAASLAKSLSARRRDSVELVPGDRWPAIALANVDGGTIQTDDVKGGLRLVYFGASWCLECVESLPELRRLAAAHPELRIVHVLWDGPNDAREFVARRGPVPGDVAWTDEYTRELLRSQVMNYVSLPSFVLVDADGTVVATSDDTELAQIETRLETIEEDGKP